MSMIANIAERIRTHPQLRCEVTPDRGSQVYTTAAIDPNAAESLFHTGTERALFRRDVAILDDIAPGAAAPSLSHLLAFDDLWHGRLKNYRGCDASLLRGWPSSLLIHRLSAPRQCDLVSVLTVSYLTQNAVENAAEAIPSAAFLLRHFLRGHILGGGFIASGYYDAALMWFLGMDMQDVLRDAERVSAEQLHTLEPLFVASDRDRVPMRSLADQAILRNRKEIRSFLGVRPENALERLCETPAESPWENPFWLVFPFLDDAGLPTHGDTTEHRIGAIHRAWQHAGRFVAALAPLRDAFNANVQ